MLATALSLMMLAALALAAGAAVLWRRGERQRPLLMVVLTAVLVLNVAIWTVPDAGGSAPVEGSP
jgi:carbon starvation protein CstA